VASKSEEHALRSQKLFHAPFFRVYTSHDVVGVEISGALKNVVAIASGACSGLGFQLNARSAIITRGLAEITRIGVACGADPLTFSGLSGVGDLFLTCTSEKSRNFTVGYRVGRGEALQHVLDTLGSVAEGVNTTEGAYTLCRKVDVDSPIVDEVYSVLYQNKDIRTSVKDLLTREASKEIKFKSS
jgi:glycerol-3-phosphate dehydrogenase (NAD(P)+)